MKSYEILEHKADLKIRVFGRDLKELFKNAMLCMEKSLEPQVKNQETKIKKKIKIKSNDLTSLLVNFLAEINYLNEVNKEVYNDIKFIKFSETELEGEIFGKKVRRFGLIIKGITYHDLNICQRSKDKIWEATILFDI